MPRRSRAAGVADSPPLPPELESRIRAFERDPDAVDFDATSWLWIIALGAALPVILLILGCWA